MRIRPVVRLMAFAGLLACAQGSLAQDIRIHLVDRETVEANLRLYAGTNAERGARLKQMFADVGCGENLSEQTVKYSKVPNVICMLPGDTGRTIIVGAHFDRVPQSEGVADNWSGASLLPSFYAAVKRDPRRHTYVFIGFTDEDQPGHPGTGTYRGLVEPRGQAPDARAAHGR
jgi:hypothetical protein